jgi:hypothetical protein
MILLRITVNCLPFSLNLEKVKNEKHFSTIVCERKILIENIINFNYLGDREATSLEWLKLSDEFTFAWKAVGG